jgi:hypothetical protein
MVLVAVLVLGLGSGLVLGYLSAMPRVKRLQKDSDHLLELVIELAEDLAWEWGFELVWEELDGQD